MKRRKLQFPVAKFRKEDGLPAIYLSHTIWLLLWRTLKGAYLNGCRHEGEKQAQTDSNVRWTVFDMFGAAFDSENKSTAFQLYEIGWNHHDAKSEDRGEGYSISPTQLLAEGREHFQRAYKETMDKLRGWRITRKLYDLQGRNLGYSLFAIAPLSTMMVPPGSAGWQGDVDVDAISSPNDWRQVWKARAA